MSDNGSSNMSGNEIERRIRALGEDSCKLMEMLLELEESLMQAEELQHTITKFKNDTASFEDKAFHSLTDKYWNDLEKQSQQLTKKAGIAADAAVNLRSSLFAARQILSDLRDEKNTTEEYYWHQLEVLRQQSAGYLNLFKRMERVLHHLKDVQTVYLGIQRRRQHQLTTHSDFSLQDVETQLNSLQCRRDRIKRSAEELLWEIQSIEQEEQRVGRFIQLSNKYLSKLKETSSVLYDENHVSMTHRNMQKTIEKMEERMKSEVRPLCAKREVLWRRHAWISYEAADCGSEHNRLAVLLQTHLDHTQHQIDTLREAVPCIDNSCPQLILATTPSADENNLSELQTQEQKKICKQSGRLLKILNLIRKMTVAAGPQLQEEIENELNELVKCEEFENKEDQLVADVSYVDVQRQRDGCDLNKNPEIDRFRYLVTFIKDHVSRFCAARRSEVTQMSKQTNQKWNKETEASLRENVVELKASCDDLKARLEAAKQTYQNLTEKLKKYQQTW